MEEAELAGTNDFAEDTYEADQSRWDDPARARNFFKQIRVHGQAINDPESRRVGIENDENMYFDILTALKYRKNTICPKNKGNVDLMSLTPTENGEQEDKYLENTDVAPAEASTFREMITLSLLRPLDLAKLADPIGNKRLGNGTLGRTIPRRNTSTDTSGQRSTSRRG